MEPVVIHIAQAYGWSIPTENFIYALIGIMGIISMLLGVLMMYLWGWVIFGFLSFLIIGMLYLMRLLSRFLVAKVNHDLAWQLVFLAAVLIRLIKPLL
jgi:hypothetical protein